MPVDQSIVTTPPAEKTALIEQADAGVLTKVALPNDTPHLLAIMEKLIEKGGSVEQMGQILALQERWEANEARKAFFAAMVQFKADPAFRLVKNTSVRYQTKSGDTVAYDHISLDEACEVVAAGLAKYGLFHRWNNKSLDGGLLEVTCIISHGLGYSESVSERSGPDTSGGKNPIQATASARSYLQRYTLLAAAGKAAKGMDDDGHASNGAPAVVTEAQANELAGIVEVKYGNDEAALGRFTAWLEKFAGVRSLDAVPAAKFDGLKKALAGIPSRPAKKGGV